MFAGKPGGGDFFRSNSMALRCTRITNDPHKISNRGTMSHFIIAARWLFALSVAALSGNHQLLTPMAANAIWTIGNPARAEVMANEQRLQSPADCGWAGVQVSPMTTPFAESLGF